MRLRHPLAIAAALALAAPALARAQQAQPVISPNENLVAEGIPPIPATLADQSELRGLLAWFPIVVSSAIFALLHLPNGPDWIPLFFLAAGMGYLYQRTHRLLPSLTVHALLNSLSMWGLWVATKSEALKP